MEMQGDFLNIGGGFTDIVVVDESQLQYNTGKRLIAIVHEDEHVSLSREQPYQTSPGCWSSHYYSEGALARRFKFVLGTPVTSSEIESLIARNKDLVEKLRGADWRVDEAVASFEKQVKELTEALKKEQVARAEAEVDRDSANRRRDEENKMRREMAEERNKAVSDLASYKAKVSEVMLLVPNRGEMSVAELVESSDVADIMGGEKK